MPFSLKCASNSFIRAVHQILQPIREFNDSYVTFSTSWEFHLSHVQAFLRRISEVGMMLNLEKCEFARPSVTFVGHIICLGQHGPDPDKVACVENIQPPKTKKEVREIISFFSYFRTYIDNFAEVAKRLTDMSKKQVVNPIQWTETHQNAFDDLKRKLCEAIKLHIIEYGKPVGISVDASSVAVGCCLFQ